MNEMYVEVREHLRQQHARNIEGIHGKKVDNFSNYRYYENDSVKNEKTSSSVFAILFKPCLFVACVLVFSFYIYGGKDIRKGADMAWNELKAHIVQMEQEEPVVKQAMGYVRKACDEVEDFTKTYINVGD